MGFKRFKYLFNGKISNSDKDSFEAAGVVETGHFKEELYDKYGKNLDLALEVIERGTHVKESGAKVKAELETRAGTWEVVYAIHEGKLVLIHMQLRK